MAFDMITKRRLFDALWARARQGQPAPSLRFIVKHSKLEDEAAAERLLRDMEADGAITVVGDVGAYPWLTIRRQSYTGDFVSAPVWLEREKAERVALVPTAVDEEEYQGASGTAREASSAEPSGSAERIEDRAPPPEPEVIATTEIRCPICRERAQECRYGAPCYECVPPSATITKMPERPEVETAETKGNGPADALTPALDRPSGTEAGEPPVQAEEAGEQAREPQPQAVEARHVLMFPLAKTDKQVNIRVPTAVHALLSAAAEAEGGGVGGVARRIFLEAFDAERCDTHRAHRIRAQIARTCAEDGFELPAFVTMLIERGFASYMVDRAAECAEAAE